MPIVLLGLFRIMAEENHSVALNRKLIDKCKRIQLLLDSSIGDIKEFHKVNPDYGNDGLDRHMGEYADYVARTLTTYFHSNGIQRFSCHYDKSLIAHGSLANRKEGGNRTRRQKKRR